MGFFNMGCLVFAVIWLVIFFVFGFSDVSKPIFIPGSGANPWTGVQYNGAYAGDYHTIEMNVFGWIWLFAPIVFPWTIPVISKLLKLKCKKNKRDISK